MTDVMPLRSAARNAEAVPTTEVDAPGSSRGPPVVGDPVSAVTEAEILPLRRQRSEVRIPSGAPAISIDLAAVLGTLEMLENASPNSNTNRDSTPTLSEDY